MAKLYYDELPPNLKPMVKYSNARLLDFQNPTQDVNEKQRNTGLRSSIRVATAGEKGVGRSETFNYMHLSELAFWDEKDGQTVQDQLTGLLQTIPNGQSFLAIESTANGYNYFKSLWMQQSEVTMTSYPSSFRGSRWKSTEWSRGELSLHLMKKRKKRSMGWIIPSWLGEDTQ